MSSRSGKRRSVSSPCAYNASGQSLTLMQDTVLEDLITFSDLLFSEMTEPQAPNLLPPGSGLSRAGAISFHPVEDGPHPGSSRTRVQIVNADTTAIYDSPIDAAAAQAQAEAGAKSREASGDSGDNANALIVVDPPATTIAEPESTMPKRSFTKDGQLDLLFDAGLIPASMRDGLPDEYHVSLSHHISCTFLLGACARLMDVGPAARF